MKTLKAATQSNPNLVAGAIANVIREDGKVKVQGIGAGSVNQIVKSIAIASGYLAPNGIEITNQISFEVMTLEEGVERTAMNFIITKTAQ